MPEGKTFYYLGCPFCGKTVYEKKIKPSTLENFSISWEILQAREQMAGPGRGRKGKGTGGFALIDEECLSIVEMAKSPEWSDLAHRVARRIEIIYKAYKEAGLIEK